MEEGGLVLTDTAEEKVADELLAALSDLAYAIPSEQPLIKRKSKYSSRFFFQVTGSLDDSIRVQAEKFKPKQMEHIDNEVTTRLKGYKKEMPPKLSENMNSVREFFLTKIAPLSLSGGAGASQAKEVVQRLLGTEIDGGQFDKFERMSHAAVNMAMAQFVADYYGLPKDAAEQILAAIQPRPPAVMPIPSMPPYESRHAKARREIESSKERKEKDPSQ